MKKQSAIPAIIDGGGHLYEETNLWIERIDRKYREDAPRPPRSRPPRRGRPRRICRRDPVSHHRETSNNRGI